MFNLMVSLSLQNYVQAHKGIEGNEHADTLAKMGASKFQRKENVRYKPY